MGLRIAQKPLLFRVTVATNICFEQSQTARASFQLDFFLGTLAPFFHASERPIAIACLGLVTTPPLPFFPEWSVPRFSRCIAFLTLSAAALPYLAISPPSKASPSVNPKVCRCNPWITLRGRLA